MEIDLIKASAGSGKTYTLMTLLSKSIASGVRPEGLLATTYTVKAAAELQSRIRQELLSSPQPELASQVFDGLIGTVNGVCGRILSEYAIESGLSPALDVLPEENADVIFNAAIHSVMDLYADDLEQAASRLELNPLKDNPHGKTYDWRRDVRKVVDLARNNRIDKVGLLDCAEKSCTSLQNIFTSEKSLSLQSIAEMIGPYRNFNAEGGDTRAAVQKIRDFLLFPTWSKAVALAKSKHNPTKDPEFPIELLNSFGDDLLASKEFYADMATVIRKVFACAGDALAAYSQYKNAFGLIDFVDQESNVLELLENNGKFRALMSQRINQVMVDEFQDTSPIQLALYLKLNECSQTGSVWVGDPKQAIYGFRGTDPALMEAVAATVPGYRTLEYSWRSKKNLVDLSNAIFKKAFSDMPEKDVVLGIPDKRKEEAVGGNIDVWHISESNIQKRVAALAGGIASLIRDKGIAPGDICVLFRSNPECAALADALAQWNISASAPAGRLLDKTECQLVMSAYRYCIDHSDTAALATLLVLYDRSSDWLTRLSQAKQEHLALPEEEQKTSEPFEALKETDWLKKLKAPSNATPLEILEYVISALGLDSKIASMDYTDLRMSNLDELRKVCSEYMNQALVNRTAATPAGFVAMLNESGRSSASGFGKNTVNVMTYHKSKGLEFPVVILGSLDSAEKNSVFDVLVQQADEFDVNFPLKDRTIHYWPWPLGKSKNFDKLEDSLKDEPILHQVEASEREERKRLLYVGLTRAKEQLIFVVDRNAPTKEALKKNPDAVDVLKIGWLESLTDFPLFSFPLEQGPGVLKVGEEKFDITTQILAIPDAITQLPSLPVYGEESVFCDFAPAKKKPSSESADGNAVLISQWDYLCGNIKCDKFDQLGSAFHDYIALNPQENGRLYAQRLLENYDVKDAVDPGVLVECCKNLYTWLAAAYPGAKISREIPITYHDEQGTLYQGFIDMLLDLPEGFVIIDHKSHPIASNAEKYAASCAGQLNLYRKAVEAATGRKVLQTIIHLPNVGKCYEVTTKS